MIGEGAYSVLYFQYCNTYVAYWLESFSFVVVVNKLKTIKKEIYFCIRFLKWHQISIRYDEMKIRPIRGIFTQ